MSRSPDSLKAVTRTATLFVDGRPIEIGKMVIAFNKSRAFSEPYGHNCAHEQKRAYPEIGEFCLAKDVCWSTGEQRLFSLPYQ